MSKIVKTEDGKVVIEFSVEKEEFKKGLDAAFKKVVKKVNAPGFRKGKLPRPVFNQMYGEEALYQDAIDYVLPKAYASAVDALDVKPLARPDIDVKEVSKENGVTFEATLTVKPEITLGDYKGLAIEKESSEVTDEDVENRLKKVLEREASWEVKDGGVSENGDIVVIDFKGFVDGVAFEGGEANGYELELGSNSFIPGYEEQLVGKEAGSEVEVNVTFPAEYQVETLAGKDAKFEVKIHDIKVKVFPEITDEFIKEFTKEKTETVEDYKKELKEELVKEKAMQVEKDYSDKVITKVVENATLTVPEKLVNQEVDSMFDNFARNLSAQGLTVDLYSQFTGKDEKALKEDMKKEAKGRVKTSFVLEEVSLKENITVSEEEVEAEIKKLADAYSLDVEEVKKRVRGADLEGELIVRKTVDFLNENNAK